MDVHFFSFQSKLSDHEVPEPTTTTQIVTNGEICHCDDDSVDDIDSSASLKITTQHNDSFESDVFDETQLTRRSLDEMGRSFRRPLARNRQESTSLQTHPILDDNLQVST
jgi:hypothetical protein